MENVEKTEYYTFLIEKYAQKNGVFELDGKLISKDEALIATPHKLIVLKDPMTSTFDVYHNDQLLTESEYHVLSSDPSLKLKKVKDKIDDSKAVYKLEAL